MKGGGWFVGMFQLSDSKQVDISYVDFLKW